MLIIQSNSILGLVASYSENPADFTRNGSITKPLANIQKHLYKTIKNIFVF